MASIESLRGRSAVGVAALLAALFFPVAGLADDEKPKAAPESPAPRVAPRIVVAVDPETGELRAPTAAEREGLQAGARQALSGTLPPTRVETLSDGRVRARLGPEYFRFSVARVNPDGTLSSECVAGGKAATAAQTAAPPVAAKPAAEER